MATDYAQLNANTIEKADNNSSNEKPAPTCPAGTSWDAEKGRCIAPLGGDRTGWGSKGTTEPYIDSKTADYYSGFLSKPDPNSLANNPAAATIYGNLAAGGANIYGDNTYLLSSDPKTAAVYRDLATGGSNIYGEGVDPESIRNNPEAAAIYRDLAGGASNIYGSGAQPNSLESNPAAAAIYRDLAYSNTSDMNDMRNQIGLDSITAANIYGSGNTDPMSAAIVNGYIPGYIQPEPVGTQGSSGSDFLRSIKVNIPTLTPDDGGGSGEDGGSGPTLEGDTVADTTATNEPQDYNAFYQEALDAERIRREGLQNTVAQQFRDWAQQNYLTNEQARLNSANLASGTRQGLGEARSAAELMAQQDFYQNAQEMMGAPKTSLDYMADYNKYLAEYAYGQDLQNQLGIGTTDTTGATYEGLADTAEQQIIDTQNRISQYHLGTAKIKQSEINKLNETIEASKLSDPNSVLSKQIDQIGEVTDANITVKPDYGKGGLDDTYTINGITIGGEDLTIAILDGRIEPTEGLVNTLLRFGFKNTVSTAWLSNNKYDALYKALANYGEKKGYGSVDYSGGISGGETAYYPNNEDYPDYK